MLRPPDFYGKEWAWEDGKNTTSGISNKIIVELQQPMTDFVPLR
jgi:hypothetical protein